MLAIRTENLSKYYQLNDTRHKDAQSALKWALKNLTIDITKGDAIAVMGNNGSGKSTLLKILSRVVHPSEGKFFANGKLSSLLEIGAGFDPELTGRENVFLTGTMLGMSYRDIKREFDTVVDFSEISEHIDTPIKHYSTGMYMRLGFAIMAHTPTEIMVIDEALSVGDVNFQQKCLKKMIELRHELGRTILLVSHNVANIRTLCNKALLLENGEMTAYGNALDIATDYLDSSLKQDVTPFYDRRDKYGNGSAVVTSIDFINESGQPTETLYSGEPLVIKFQIEKRDEINEKDIIVACTFGPSFGQYLIAWLSSESDAHPKNGSITLNIDSLDLRPGKYYFSYRLGVGNADPENIADALENGFVFTVLSHDKSITSFPSCIGGGIFSDK